MTEKTYFTMAEVSRKAQVPEYTVRYWEQKFRLLRPLRLASGHRRYTRADIDTLLEIKDLVFIKGYSLDGARKALAAKKRQKRSVKAVAATATAKHDLLEEVRKELQQLIKEL
ncbi:MAG: MerR family transcriptional regulator [Elusimicrobiales bacterium]|jgi:DNA-binding transcriptional MerR regulator|nr:MerR family transcriptional regulator [Elusimicrobiales bacterium]